VAGEEISRSSQRANTSRLMPCSKFLAATPAMRAHIPRIGQLDCRWGFCMLGNMAPTYEGNRGYEIAHQELPSDERRRFEILARSAARRHRLPESIWNRYRAQGSTTGADLLMMLDPEREVQRAWEFHHKRAGGARDGQSGNLGRSARC